MTIATLTDIKQLPSPALGFLPAIHDAAVEQTPTKFITLDSAWTVLEYGVRQNFPATGEDKKLYVDVSQDKIYQFTELQPGSPFDYVEIPESQWAAAAIQKTPKYPTPNTAEGRVFVNQLSNSITIPPFGGWPARQISPGQFYGSDGRGFYRVVNKPLTTSYYPFSFERTIYSMSFSDKSLPVGDTFEFSRLFYFRLIGNNTPVVWSVIFEIGYRVDDVSPAPVGPNLGTFVWLPPLVEQQIFITDVKTKHAFGIFMRRRPEKTSKSSAEPAALECDAMLYNKAASIDPSRLPSTMDFMLRIRLAQFDTDNSEKDPRGFLAYTVRAVDDPEEN